MLNPLIRHVIADLASLGYVGLVASSTGSNISVMLPIDQKFFILYILGLAGEYY